MSRRAVSSHRFDRHGLLAIDPKAFFELFFAPATRAKARVGQVDVIEISGPLVQRDEMWCDSYEAIRARVHEACASDGRAIVMRFDSPGGDASGCFETARAIREDAAKANKPLIAYVDKACSAAYALATAATVIVIGDTCPAGSIGVLSSRPDLTAANAQSGLRVAFVASGARKLDGNPDSPITDAELVETQRHVDGLAAQFFELISEQRPQLSAATVAGFDGAVFYGNGAVNAGLADGVATFDQALAFASSEDPMGLFAKSEYDTARGMLEKMAKGGDANASAAKRALAAMAEAEPPKHEEPDGDEPKPDAEEPAEDKPDAESDDKDPDAAAVPAAMDDDEPPADKKPKSVAAPGASTATASASSAELQLAARVHRLEARAAAEGEARERATLIARRPDFGPELRAALSKAPIATVRDMVKTLPKGPIAKRAPITTVASARGSTQGPAALAPSSETADMDRRMGLTQQKFGCRREGSTMFFGVVADELPETPPAAAITTDAGRS
jgi:ClpP class serine protease